MAAKPARVTDATRNADQPKQPATPSIQDRIRIRAYELYEARKGAPGDPEGDWYQAEAEIVGKIAEQAE